jgi:hypothetical protein
MGSLLTLPLFALFGDIAAHVPALKDFHGSEQRSATA